MFNTDALFSLLFFSTIFIAFPLITGHALLIIVEQHHPLIKPLDLRTPLALILGLSLIPLLLLWATTLGLHLHATIIWIYFGLAGLINLFWLRNNFTQLKNDSSRHDLLWLIVILALTWLTRFGTVQGFASAPGGDSYHHTLITSLIVNLGQIPTSYEPYAPAPGFTYHFGFHAINAFFYWLTYIPLPKLTLWTGQGISALVILAVYFFVKQITEKGHIAHIAAYVVGLISVYPAYMVNWSRFTQLSGLLLLILTFGLIIPRNHLKYWPITSILIGSIFLCHYRIFAILGLLVIAMILVELFFEPTTISLKTSAGLILLILMGVALVIPWLIEFLSRSQLFQLSNAIYSNVSASSESLKSYYDLERLGESRFFYSNYILGPLAIIGIINHFIRHRKTMFILSSWTILMFISSNPYWLPIPGAGLLDLNSVVMSIFGQTSLWAALAISLILEFKFISYIPFYLKMAIVFLITGCAMMPMFTIADSREVYLQTNDLQALEWIKTQTPPDAKFLVNPVIFAWSPVAVTGNDAGYWIPLLTGRQNTIFPQVTLNEKLPRANLQTQTKLAQAAIQLNDHDLPPILKTENIDYIMIGSKGGPISATVLEHAPYATQVWHQGNVWIFKINQPAP